jgi:hypothetical protein
MGRPEEIIRRHLGEEVNCDAAVTCRASGKTVTVEAHIPVFAGAALLATLDAVDGLAPGDEVRRLPDGKVFTVKQLLGRSGDGRCRVELAPK